MPRKKKSIQPSPAIKSVLIVVLCLFIASVCVWVITGVIKKSDYFFVKTIVIDSSLRFIKENDLIWLKGQNIFKADLNKAQRKLTLKYPQAAQLKVARQFPNQIKIEAKKRMPFAQVGYKDKVYVMDDKGVILSKESKPKKKLPMITGLKLKSTRLSPGLHLKGTDIYVALKIIKYFEDNKDFSVYRMVDINVNNLSKIYLLMSNKIEVILDRNKIEKRMRILELILTQRKLDLKQVKYIDLRFKEPIVGKK